jgi:hypothetical protein
MLERVSSWDLHPAGRNRLRISCSGTRLATANDLSCKLFRARSSSCVYFLPPRFPNKAGRFLVRRIRDIISRSEHRHLIEHT